VSAVADCDGILWRRGLSDLDTLSDKDDQRSGVFLDVPVCSVQHADAFDAGRIMLGRQAAYHGSASVNPVSLSDMIRSLVLILAASLSMGAEPPSASSVMSAAQAEAGSQHKAVLLIFHASWCGWLPPVRPVPRNP